MHILFSRFFSYFFSEVIQCAQFACIFESFVTSCHTNGRVWKASFLWQRSLNLIQDVSRTHCTFVRFLCTSQSTSSTNSKLGPGVSSDILMYHRRWGPMSMFRSCRSGGEHLCIEPLAHFIYLPVMTFYSWSLLLSLISYLYMLENPLVFFLGRKDVGNILI